MSEKGNNGSTKAKTGYHMMLFLDGKDGQIRQMGVSQKTMNFIVILVLLLIIIPFIGWKLTQDKAYKLQGQLNVMTAKYEATEQQRSELETQNGELTKKVTVLSDTVNEKVKQENQQVKEETIAHMPTGFPLSSSASMEKSEDEKTPYRMIFTASEDSSVIASGEGVVEEITSDDKYANKILIDHDNGYKSVYYNDGSPMVKEGDKVVTSSVLFVIGDKNQKVGYEILKDGENVDPMEVIKIDG